MEATFKGNHKTVYSPIVLVTIFTKHARSRKIWKPLVKETPVTMAFFRCNGYNRYQT